MLLNLRVRDLVLIEELDLELSPGFNVLTGETGAGKSLVAAAVNLLLGAPAGPESVRRGAEQAEVEGLFDVSDEPGVEERLREAGLPVDGELLVRRVVPAGGRQRCFVNGRLSSRAVLTRLAEDLASFAGQHEHLALLKPSLQLALLDAYAGLEPEVARMAEAHDAAVVAERALTSLREKESDRAQRLDYLAFQLEEIDGLAPAPDELTTLDRDIERFKHAELLRTATRRSADELYEADGSVYERLGEIARELEGASRHDPALAADARAAAEAAELVEEAARRLSDYSMSAEADPDRLDEMVERRQALADLVRKHGTDLSGVLELREEIAAEIGRLSRYEAALEEAIADRDRTREEARRRATALTAARRKAAKRIARAVAAEMADLALGAAAFEVSLEEVEGEPGPAGRDAVEFLVALNPGEGAHPIRKVASGGELSRLMLAIRRAVAGTGPVGTYVFDEVDAGIGGAVASAVGRKLKEVAGHHQVICVTHLPQIAGLAETHYAVRKSERAGRTHTAVVHLDDGARVEELARMLGGDTLTDKTRAAARELLAVAPGKD